MSPHASHAAVLSSDLHGYILNGAARSQLHSLWACGMRYVWHSIQFGAQSPRRNSVSLWPNPLMQQRFVGEICSFKLTAYVLMIFENISTCCATCAAVFGIPICSCFRMLLWHNLNRWMFQVRLKSLGATLNFVGSVLCLRNVGRVHLDRGRARITASLWSNTHMLRVRLLINKQNKYLAMQSTYITK